MTAKTRWTIKEDCEVMDITMLSPKLMIMFATLLEFADSRNLPVKITSIISDRIDVQAKSKTHEQGRALDFSILGWREKDVEDIQAIMLLKHKDIAAISASDLKARPVVVHNAGYGSHGHLQCRR